MKHLLFICFPLTSELQSQITENERRMAELKQLSIQLQQKCTEPCKDTVEIQPTTGSGKPTVTLRPFPFHKQFLNRASWKPHCVLVQCLVRDWSISRISAEQTTEECSSCNLFVPYYKTSFNLYKNGSSSLTIQIKSTTAKRSAKHAFIPSSMFYSFVDITIRQFLKDDCCFLFVCFLIQFRKWWTTCLFAKPVSWNND